MLGKDETRIQEVDVQPVKAYVKAIGDPNATPIELAAVPQDGDSPEKNVAIRWAATGGISRQATGCYDS